MRLPCLILALSLLAVGAAGQTAWDRSVNEWVAGQFPDKDIPEFEEYVQYLPSAMHLGLGLAGANCRNGAWDRVIESAIGHAVCIITVKSAKAIVGTKRPDENRRDSFPSGHTAIAFTGAGLCGYEYGIGWGVGAYALGTTVGAMRLYHNHHWLSDVLVGAGVGILSAGAGIGLREPVKKLFGIDTSGSREMAFLPSYNPWGGGWSFSFGLVF